jgi:hypothetical protein
MAGLDSSPWALAGGSATVFALGVVLDRLPWQAAFAASVVAVLIWAWQAGPLAGAALGGIAWMCVTGFDVHRLGYIAITGSDDIVRAAVLVLAGLLAASGYAVVAAARRRRRAGQLRADLHEADHTAEIASAAAAGRVIPMQRRAGEPSLETNRGNKTDG